jgi:hypothetical protein
MPPPATHERAIVRRSSMTSVVALTTHTGVGVRLVEKTASQVGRAKAWWRSIGAQPPVAVTSVAPRAASVPSVPKWDLS